METRFILQTVFEIVVAGFIIYGLFFEAKFAETERKAIRYIKRALRRTFGEVSFKSNRT